MTVTVLDVLPAFSRHSRRIVTDVGTVTVPNPLIKQLGISKSMAFESMDVLTDLILDNAYDPARERAFRLLGYRERSVQELDQKLHTDGYPDVVISKVLQRLLDLDLLDDERFATHLIASKQAAGIGRLRIARELQDAGVNSALADSLLDTLCASTDESMRARNVIRSRVVNNKHDAQRLIERLIRRGYAIETARTVVNERLHHSPDTGF
ncbi:MAG: regulatory protein RecX [Actinomycetota bacterium]|jgi:SOS response regulatory protein OraA/RecX|nr:regulatory protein RecX [Actinomycetota bacterium]